MPHNRQCGRYRGRSAGDRSLQLFRNNAHLVEVFVTLVIRETVRREVDDAQRSHLAGVFRAADELQVRHDRRPRLAEFGLLDGVVQPRQHHVDTARVELDLLVGVLVGQI